MISIAFVVRAVLRTPEELQNVDYDASGKRVVVFASTVF